MEQDNKSKAINGNKSVNKNKWWI